MVSSSSRRRQIVADRERTAAISMYLADRREDLLKNVSAEAVLDRHRKRKALEKLARVSFKNEPKSVQDHYVSQADAARSEDVVAQDLPQPLEGSLAQDPPGELAAVAHDGVKASGSDPLGDLALVAHEGVGASGSALVAHEGVGASGSDLSAQASKPSVGPQVAAVVLCTPPRKRARPEASCGSGWSAGSPPAKTRRPRLEAGTQTMAQQSVYMEERWSTTGRCPVRDGLARALPVMRALCGDIGAAEAFAQSLRVVDATERAMAQWHVSDKVKIAVIAGIGVKVTQTRKDHLVVRLWSRIAGKAAEPSIRKLEPKIISTWTAKSLASEYLLHQQ